MMFLYKIIDHIIIVILLYASHVLCQYSLDEATRFYGMPPGSECSWDGVIGRCVNVHQCLTAVMDIKTKIYPPICKFDGTTPIICCTDCRLVKDTRLLLFDRKLGILAKTGTNKARDKCLEFIHQINFACKMKSYVTYSKVVNSDKSCTFLRVYQPPSGSGASGGVDAKRGQYPHMALLGYGISTDTASWVCGGTLISERFILTAAHCLHSPRLGRVRFIGLGILKRSDPAELWQLYNVKRAIYHPGYKPPSKYHDIALLESDRQIRFNVLVRPACLHADNKPDTYGFATGWGALGHNQALADILQSVKVNAFDEKECSLIYPAHRLRLKGFNNATQICYGDRSKTLVPTDTCEGDSGGPLQSLEHENCVFTIIGVTSYGLQCGLRGGAGMYSRVRYYVPWIEDIVWP